MNSDQTTYSHLRIVKVTGEDALDFLQGQLTNDLQNLDRNWQYHGYCSPKGRTMAVFIAWRTSNAIYLMTDSSVFETVISRLRMYVLRSKVVFEPLKSNDLLGHHSQSASASKSLGMYTMEQHEGYFMLGFGDRVLTVNVESSTGAEPPSILKQEGQICMAEERWKEADIRANLPRVTEETHESFVPQMLNLDIVDGISFKKGCYTGQEIVARMRYLGKLKQRQYAAELSEPVGVNIIGNKVLTKDGKNAGEITNSIQNSKLVSAVLRTELIGESLFLESEEAISISVSDQPYPIENTK